MAFLSWPSVKGGFDFGARGILVVVVLVALPFSSAFPSLELSTFLLPPAPIAIQAPPNLKAQVVRN